MPKQPGGQRTLSSIEEEATSRLEEMRRKGLEPLMPPCSSDHHIQTLMDLGPVEVAGMDRVPITWPTIAAYSMFSGTHLEPWEAKMIRRLSADWLSASREAEEPDAAPPWTSSTVDMRAAVDRMARDVFETFKIRQSAARDR